MLEVGAYGLGADGLLFVVAGLLCLALVCCLSFVATIWMIRADAFKRFDAPKSSKALVAGSLGGVAGVFLGRLIMPDFDQYAILVVLVVGSLSIAAVCPHAMIVNFIKHYYVKKYAFEDPDNYSTSSMKEEYKAKERQRRREMSRFQKVGFVLKKVGLIFVAVLFASVAVASVFGLLRV
jgi:hypothetical protein